MPSARSAVVKGLVDCSATANIFKIMTVLSDLSVELPPGWVERPEPHGPKEYWATHDGSSGILQVSELEPGDSSFLSTQADLGALAHAMALRLGAGGQNWGNPGPSKEGPCALGRFGVSMFTGGQFPVMILWITVSARSAFMWTWLGPDPTAEEVGQAFQLVLSARHRPSN